VDRKALQKEIKRNPRFTRLKDSFDSLPMYRLPLENLEKEVETYHKARSIQRLNSRSSDFIDAVIEAVTTDISTRGRLTFIALQCVKSSKSLELAVSLLSDYILSNYGDKIKTFASTISERQKIVDGALREFKEYIYKVESLKAQVDLVVADIDKNSFQMRLIVDAFRVDRKPETRL
jgi:hypothetical protein